MSETMEAKAHQAWQEAAAATSRRTLASSVDGGSSLLLCEEISIGEASVRKRRSSR